MITQFSQISPELSPIAQLLDNTLKSHTPTVRAATDSLLNLARTDQSLPTKLFRIALAEPNVPDPIRKSATLYLQNMAEVNDIDIPQPVRQSLTSEAIPFLGSPSKSIQWAATKIILAYVPQDDYTSILTCIELISSAVNNQNSDQIDGAISLYTSILSSNLTKIASNDFNLIEDKTLTLLMTAATLTQSPKTIINIIRNLYHTLARIETLSEEKVNRIFEFCTTYARHEDPSVKSEAIDTFAMFLMLLNRPAVRKAFQPIFVPLMDFTLICLQDDNEDILRAAIGFWANLEDLRTLDTANDIPPRLGTLIPLIIKNLQFKSDDLHFYKNEMLDADAQGGRDSAIPVAWGSNSNDDDDDEDSDDIDTHDNEYSTYRMTGGFTLRKSASTTLEIIGDEYKTEIVPIVTDTLNQIITQSNEISEQPQTADEVNFLPDASSLIETALLALGCLAYHFSVAALQFPDQLNNILKWVLSQTTSPFPLVRLRATWVIGEFSSWIVGPLGTQNEDAEEAKRLAERSELDEDDEEPDNDPRAPHAPTTELLNESLPILGKLVKDPHSRIQQTAVYALRMIIHCAGSMLSDIAPQFFTIFADVFMTSPPLVQLAAARSITMVISHYPDIVRDPNNFEPSTPLAVMLLAIINNIQASEEGRDQYNTHLISLLQDVIEVGESNVPIPVATSMVNAVVPFVQGRLEKLANTLKEEGKMGSVMTNSLTMSFAFFETIVEEYQAQSEQIMASVVASQIIPRCASLSVDDDSLLSLFVLTGTCARHCFSIVSNALDAILTRLHEPHVWSSDHVKLTSNAIWCFGELVYFSKGQISFPFPMVTYLEQLTMIFTRDNRTTVNDEVVNRSQRDSELSAFELAAVTEQTQDLILNASQCICHFLQLDPNTTVQFLTTFQFPPNEKHPQPYPSPIRYILVALTGFKDKHFDEKEVAYLQLAKAAQMHPMVGVELGQRTERSCALGNGAGVELLENFVFSVC
ncbi:hypothetical protein BLNAU_8911 [Blattamonas nauphoetae]|uniref:Uncharacterized protein n=1 Tax=Blattamonas nauphoetae TaxID=2049346 RepID=A0ABQ9XXB5_9EUKA|nr:hypothetical protein BLNAU_8911 [Blattamonas nauphoetae]